MRAFIVDTGALSLFFAGDIRVKPYFDKVLRGGASGYMAGVNLAEYYYKTCHQLGKQTADARYYQTLKLLTVVETDTDLTREAGQEKCRSAQLSLADCFGLALAQRLHGLLLTSDAELAELRQVQTKLFEV